MGFLTYVHILIFIRVYCRREAGSKKLEAHEREIRPAKPCPHHSFGNNKKHHHQNIATY
jgi:hypothetical protein